MGWKRRSGIMLCQPLDDKNLARNLFISPILLAQPKIDGMRCWVSWSEDGRPNLWSSEGNPITGVPHIEMLLKDFAAQSGQRPQFDGELYTPEMEFEKLVGLCKRHVPEESGPFLDIQYHIFDHKGEGTQIERLRTLQDLLDTDQAEGQYLKLVEFTKVKNQEEIDNLLELYISQGYEGIILRNPLASYVEKRVFTILKWKPSKSDQYRVVKVLEAISEDGTPLGRVGSLTCEDRDGNIFNVGTGIGANLKDLQVLWEQRRELPGKFVKVYYQNLTAKGVPRFGKFVPTFSLAEEQDFL